MSYFDALVKDFENSSDYKVKKEVVEKIIQSPDKRKKDFLIKVAINKNENKWVRIATFEFLLKSGDTKDIEILIQLLNEDDDKNVRQAIVRRFTKSENPLVIKELVKAITDRNEEIAKSSTQRIAELGIVEGILKILEVLENKDDTHLRLRVLPSLGATKDKRIISKLIETASDVNQQSFVRSKALTSLERIKDDDVLDLLLKIKEDENEDKYRRASATRGLENYSEPEIYDILEKDARDTSKDEVVRRSAMKVLAASYDETKDYILELFIELLKDKDPKVVNGAVYYLGEIGDPRAIKPLQEVNKLLQLKTHKPGRITYSREDMSLESTLKQAFETIRRKEIDRRLK